MPASGNKPDAEVTNRTVDRRQFLLGCTTFAAAAGMGDVTPVNAALTLQPPAAQSRPNILFMLGDNIGYGVLSSTTAGSPTRPRRASIRSVPMGCGSRISTSKTSARRAPLCGPNTPGCL
jgi:hypothetical protein